MLICPGTIEQVSARLWRASGLSLAVTTLAVLLAACFPPPAPAPTPLPPPTRPPSPSPSPLPSQSSSPITSPSQSYPLLPSRLEDQPAAIADYLNAAPGNRVALGQFVSERSRSANQPTDRLIEIDLDGDQKPELVLIVYSEQQRDVSTAGPRGFVAAYREAGGRYELLPVPGGIAETAQAGPTILKAEDLNRNSGAELAFSYRSCGASTCFDSLAIVGWDGARLKRLTPESLQMANPSISIADLDGDGVAEIVLTGGLQGSLGAGLQRQRTETYLWNGAQWSLAKTEFAPSTERYFALVDAERAFAQRNFGTALRLYRSAANDASLANTRVQQPSDPGPDLRAFARFRLLVTDVVVGQEDDAMAVLTEARQQDAATAFVNLTETFWRNYTHTGSIRATCDQVVAMVAADPRPYLETLNGYGYANQDFKPGDLCRLV